MGALVGGGALPFVASVRYLAGPMPDSTLALFSVSLTNQTLTFQRRGSEFVAEYHVEVSFRTDSTSLAAVRQIGSDEQVRVRNFQETLRSDESVIYQQFLMLPPGVYYVMAMVRDRNGPAFARAERADTAPRFAASAGRSAPRFRSWSPTRARPCRTALIPCASMSSATGRHPGQDGSWLGWSTPAVMSCGVTPCP